MEREPSELEALPRLIQRKEPMRKNELSEKERRNLKCPLCGKTIARAEIRSFGLQGGAQPGELTECGSCFAILEFRGDRTCPTLHPASRERARQLANFERSLVLDFKLSELIEHVRRYRQMPVGPPIGHQLRRVSR